MQSFDLSEAARRPPLPLLFSEPARAAFELGAAFASTPWLATSPRGDGHAVLVLPGLFADDSYTAPLRLFLRAKGFEPHGWGRGLNRGDWDALEDAVLPLVDRLFRESGRPVSVVGASMGGLYARAAAHCLPKQVRCVVTLGSAAHGPHRSNHVWPVFEQASGQDATAMAVPAPPVPSTSVFSRTDGLSDWQPCVQDSGDGIENVEVVSSHLGLAWHPAVLHLIADRLAQQPEEWQPFVAPTWARALYPQGALTSRRPAP